MNLLTTFAGSMMEGFLPAGWDLARIDACCAHKPGQIGERQAWWHPDFELIPCASCSDFDVMMGHEIATAIRRTRDHGRAAALILPVGPMGMYRWAVYFLKEWNIPCDHVHGFNMDEWSDKDGATLPPENPGAFQYAMQQAFYGPLGSRTVPESQRWFATADRLPHYAQRIGELKSKGAELIVIFGIGRVCHIAFWEPHFAAEFPSLGRLEGPDSPPGRAVAPADHRAERSDQLQEPDDPGSGLCQHDRSRAVPQGRSDHRRRRRRLRPGHAVAGNQSVDDLALRSGSLGAQLVHADPDGPALLSQRSRRPPGAGA